MSLHPTSCSVAESSHQLFYTWTHMIWIIAYHKQRAEQSVHRQLMLQQNRWLRDSRVKPRDGKLHAILAWRKCISDLKGKYAAGTMIQINTSYITRSSCSAQVAFDQSSPSLRQALHTQNPHLEHNKYSIHANGIGLKSLSRGTDVCFHLPLLRHESWCEMHATDWDKSLSMGEGNYS